MRRWLIVVDDPGSEIDSLEAAEAWFRAVFEDPGSGLVVNTVQRGGLLAEKIVGELVPVRHERMGRGRA